MFTVGTGISDEGRYNGDCARYIGTYEFPDWCITCPYQIISYDVTLRWVETRQLLPLLRSRLPETWSVTPTQAATVVGEE